MQRVNFVDAKFGFFTFTLNFRSHYFRKQFWRPMRNPAGSNTNLTSLAGRQRTHLTFFACLESCSVFLDWFGRFLTSRVFKTWTRGCPTYQDYLPLITRQRIRSLYRVNLNFLNVNSNIPSYIRSQTETLYSYIIWCWYSKEMTIKSRLFYYISAVVPVQKVNQVQGVILAQKNSKMNELPRSKSIEYHSLKVSGTVGT